MIDSDVIVALKTSFSKYDIKKTTIFNIKDIDKNFTSFNFVSIKSKEIIFKIKCPLCKKNHIYKYNLSELINKKAIIGGCETLNTPLFFLGKEEPILKIINQYEYINGKLSKIIE